MLAGVLAGFIGVWMGISFADVAPYAVTLIPEGFFPEE